MTLSCLRFRLVVGFAMLACVSLFLFATPSAFGQAAAGFIGQVTDQNGAALPGAKVTVTGPALQVPSVSAVVDDQGAYRIVPLPIGIYSMEVTLAGFETAKRDNLRLTVGFVAKVDSVLKIGSVAETVTITSASPLLDVTSAGASTTLTQENIQLVPTGRNGWISLAAQTPGVRGNLDVAGTAMLTAPEFMDFGLVGQSWETIDGVTTSTSSDQQLGNYFDYNTFAQAQVQAIGNDAEMPRQGVLMRAVLKSGSNEFHGGGSYYQSTGGMQNNNITAGLRALGVTGAAKIAQRWDIAGDLGGKIIPNKLWFFGAARARVQDPETLNVFKPNGSQAVDIGQFQNYTGKGSYQLTPSQRFEAFYMYNRLYQETGDGTFTPWISRYLKHLHDDTGKFSWQLAHGSSIVVDAQIGWMRQFGLSKGADPTQPATMDNVTQEVTGDNIIDGYDFRNWSWNPKASISWYKPKFLPGNHALKAGVDGFDETMNPAYANLPYGNYREIFSNGVPFELQTFNNPVDPYGKEHYLGVFLEDKWAIGRNLILDLGVRYAHDHGFAPPQCQATGQFVAAQCYPQVQMPVWNPVVPRLHAVYDLDGHGTTVIKGGWGRFAHLNMIRPETNSLNRVIQTTTTWLWKPPAGVDQYEPGQINLNLNGPAFVSASGETFGVPNPNLHEPMLDEFSLSVERQVLSNFSLRVTGIYSRAFNQYLTNGIERPPSVYTIPVTNPDPGPYGNDPTGKSITYYAYPSSLSGQQNSYQDYVNSPSATQTYKSIEVAAVKRFARGWELIASFSATKQHIPQGVESTSGYPGNDPNSQFNIADNTWQSTGRASGAYTFRYGIVVSSNYEHRSGQEWAREALFKGPGTTIPSILLNVEPIGSRYLPDINLLDFRIDKKIPLGKERNLSVGLNIFNSLNLSTVLALNEQSGSTFLKPTSIITPRTLEIRAAYTF